MAVSGEQLRERVDGFSRVHEDNTLAHGHLGEDVAQTLLLGLLAVASIVELLHLHGPRKKPHGGGRQECARTVSASTLQKVREPIARAGASSLQAVAGQPVHQGGPLLRAACAVRAGIQMFASRSCTCM